jgi:chromosome segregation ATPase
MPELEERMAKIEGIVEQMNERLNHIETGFSELRTEMGSLRDEIRSNFRWIVGIILTMWVTIILTLLFK